MNSEALRLYLVTNRYQDSLENFLEKVETACRSGVTIIQLREKISPPINTINWQNKSRK